MGDFSIDYSNGSDTMIGSIVGSGPFESVGTYFVNWQIIDAGQDIAGDSVQGMLTITDLGDPPSVPEPSSVGLTAAGLGLFGFAWRRRLRA